MTEGRDQWWDEECDKVPAYCPCEHISSEDPLFILYVSRLFSRCDDPVDLEQTSGSTGKPKGVVHCTGGYLLGALLTVKYVFDVHSDPRA